MILVANWKMYRSYQETYNWLSEHGQELALLAQEKNFVICPDYCTIVLCTKFLHNVGAQDCSENASGAYTGQISAQTLKELGVTHCLVGHNETRHEHYTSHNLAKKTAMLLIHGITPIMCIGEKYAHTASQEALAEIFPDLVACAQAIKAHAPSNDQSLIFAYEPVWAIGSGKTPSIEHVTSLVHAIKKFAHEHLAQYKTKVLYGGSVTATTVKTLVCIPELDGFLVGKASLDMQELKKIVRLCTEEQL